MPDRSDASHPNPIRGLVAGAIAGLVASVVMNQVQKIAGRLVGADQRSHGAQSQQRGTPEHGIGAYLDERGIDSPGDTAPARLANAATFAVTGERLDRDAREKAGTAIHYLYGTSMAAAYGLAAEVYPQITVGNGAGFGAALWLAADEMVTPALGLSKAPTEYPASIHAYALGSHVAYGLTTEVVRRYIRDI